jgi:hypothetical protein
MAVGMRYLISADLMASLTTRHEIMAYLPIDRACIHGKDASPGIPTYFMRVPMPASTRSAVAIADRVVNQLSE